MSDHSLDSILEMILHKNLPRLNHILNEYLHRILKTMGKSNSIKEKTSVLTDKEKTILNLSLGKKEAVTEEEKKLVNEIEAIKKEGKMIYIPHD